MKFGQLKEYDMRKTYLEKLYTKCGGEIVFRPLLKSQNWACFWINSLKFYTACFYCIKLRAIDMYWNEAADHLLLPDVRLFSKNKKRSGTSLSASFCAWFF